MENTVKYDTKVASVGESIENCEEDIINKLIQEIFLAPRPQISSLKGPTESQIE